MSSETWTHGFGRALEGEEAWVERPVRGTPRPVEPIISLPEEREGRLPDPERWPASAAGEEVRPAGRLDESRPMGQVPDDNPAFSSFIETLCGGDRICLKRLLDTLERLIIIRALNRSRGNQRAAAVRLGLKYTTLNEKVKKHGLRFSKSVQSAKTWTSR